MRTREASGRQLTVAVNVRLAAGDMEALDGLLPPPGLGAVRSHAARPSRGPEVLRDRRAAQRT
jgi:hypothetical protein